MKKLLIVMALTTMTVAASAQLRSGINLNDVMAVLTVWVKTTTNVSTVF